MISAAGENSASLLETRGVYTLASDAVIEWFQAFIRSFRKANPTLPLTVIPYNKSISQVQMLASEYSFTIMDLSDCCHFDELESVIMGQGRSEAMFRKWACFFGSYKNFIFLDADMVVTSALDVILDAFARTSYDLLYFDVSISMVYAPEAISEMKEKYGSAGFNAGAFVSRRGIISHDELQDASRRAAVDRRKLAADQVDQPFLNYVFDTLRKAIISNHQVLPQFAPSAWARQPFTYDWATDVPRNADQKVMPFIHWAGCAYPTMVRPEVFLRHRTRGLSPIARIGYRSCFYFRRYWFYLLKTKLHVKTVAFKFFTSKSWRRFYLYKLIGIKIKLPL